MDTAHLAFRQLIIALIRWCTFIVSNFLYIFTTILCLFDLIYSPCKREEWNKKGLSPFFKKQETQSVEYPDSSISIPTTVGCDRSKIINRALVSNYLIKQRTKQFNNIVVDSLNRITNRKACFPTVKV